MADFIKAGTPWDWIWGSRVAWSLGNGSGPLFVTSHWWSFFLRQKPAGCPRTSGQSSSLRGASHHDVGI